jgi:hypothetical protein
MIETPAPVRLVRLRPFANSAVVSTFLSLMAFAVLAVVALLVTAAGLIAAVRARTEDHARLTSTVVSIGVGLTIGPLLYVLVAPQLRL